MLFFQQSHRVNNDFVNSMEIPDDNRLKQSVNREATELPPTMELKIKVLLILMNHAQKKVLIVCYKTGWI